MDGAAVILTLKEGKKTARVEGMRVVFSAHRCFSLTQSSEERGLLQVLGEYLLTQKGIAFFGKASFLKVLIDAVPALKTSLCLITDPALSPLAECSEIRSVSLEALPNDINTVFLGETLTFPRSQMRKKLPPRVKVIEPDIVVELAPNLIPESTWIPIERNIYPIDLPEIEFKKGLDLLILDCPARNLALMPNGLGYVSNALKKTEVSFQIFDLDIIAYHRFHINRLFDEGGRITLSSGRELPIDPWLAENYDLWSSGFEHESTTNSSGILSYFFTILEEVVDKVVIANPKILGFSLQQCNEAFTREVIRRVRKELPDLIVLVGGYSCYNPDIGRRSFLEADYMCLGEAELTVGPLMEALARGERPANQPGILSRFDRPDYQYIPGPMPHNLDQIDFPRYEWFDLSLYQNYNGYQLTPIIASRGCRWSRCTFCAERFYWRIRSAANFVDELEWLFKQGCTLFMFNESDLNGMPEKLLEICDEIVRRGLHKKIKLTGQLRINRQCDRAFFDRLRAAGMVALRFGVDAFSENTLRLQKKGYTTEVISQNLKDCWEAGIFTEVNWVIGVPGETEADVQEGIELILKNKNYIGRLANINPLILVNGSVYWIDPVSYHIEFRSSKEEIYEKYPRAVPADLWYSTGPYIDAQVRKQRFEKIVTALYDAGFPVGTWATRIIEDVKLSRDTARTGKCTSPTSETDSSSKKDEQPIVNPALTSLEKKSESPSFRILDFEEEHFLLQEKEYQIAFQRKKFSTAPVEKEISTIVASSPLRRLAAKLPKSIQAELRRILRVYRCRLKGESSPLQADRSIVAMLAKGVIKEHLIKPLKNTMRSMFAASRRSSNKENEGEGIQVVHVVTKGALPELMCEIGNFNIVRYEGEYYAIPHGLLIDWENEIVKHLPGVMTAKRLSDLMHHFSEKDSSTELPVPDPQAEGPAESINSVPILIHAVEGYNIVAYEGWYYGLPQSMGNIDLSEVDVLEKEGVIRDVSRDVVESEIFDRIYLQKRHEDRER